MSSEFQGKTVLVTGGTGALGAAVAALFAERGAACHVTASRPGAKPPHPSVQMHAADLSDERVVTELYASLPPLWASIHVVGGFAMSPITETSLAGFRDLFDTNTVTCFLCCREAVRKMRGSSPVGGRIVNVAARPAVAPAPGMIAYAASKAAVAAITTSLAEEVKAEGILVNAVLPSTMDTPANRAAMPKADFAAWPKVTEVAEAIAFLASPLNTLTSGALVPVYGRA